MQMNMHLLLADHIFSLTDKVKYWWKTASFYTITPKVIPSEFFRHKKAMTPSVQHFSRKFRYKETDKLQYTMLFMLCNAVIWEKLLKTRNGGPT